MYAGAYLWHAVALVTIAVLLGMLYRHWSWVQKCKTYRLVGNPQALEEAPLMGNQHAGGASGGASYGAVLIELRRDPVPTRALKHLYAVSITSMLLLWCFQWSFWIGFIGLALDECVIHPKTQNFVSANHLRFCPPNLPTLTAVWAFFSWAGVVLGAA